MTEWTFKFKDRVVTVASPPRAGTIERRYSLVDEYLGKLPELYDVLFDDGMYETGFRPVYLVKEQKPDAPDGPDHT